MSDLYTEACQQYYAAKDKVPARDRLCLDQFPTWNFVEGFELFLACYKESAFQDYQEYSEMYDFIEEYKRELEIAMRQFHAELARKWKHKKIKQAPVHSMMRCIQANEYLEEIPSSWDQI